MSYVYAEILVAPRMILARWPGLGRRVTGGGDWLYSPLVGCTYCVAGQAAFWSYPLLSSRYSFVVHVVFTCACILIVVGLMKLGLGPRRETSA